MFEIKGKYLISRYYARHIPFISKYIYEMSLVKRSSFFYKTIPFPTRLISLEGDFTKEYARRLRKYLNQAEESGLTIHRPHEIPDIVEMYRSVQEAKNLAPLPPGIAQHRDGYVYSEVHHPQLGRLAAHISIADEDEKTVFGLVNVSEFRKYSTPEDQRLCSIANKYLFHRDMQYFQELGYRHYDMVGTGEPMNQMKKEFGGEIVLTYTHVPRPWSLLQRVSKLLKI